jgi:hypothetical protein
VDDFPGREAPVAPQPQGPRPAADMHLTGTMFTGQEA